MEVLTICFFCRGSSALLSLFHFTFVQTKATRSSQSMAPSLASDLAHIQEVKMQRLQGGHTSIYFASVIAAVILVFACVHWLKRLHHRLNSGSTSLGRTISKWSTPVKKYLYGSNVYGVEVLPERVALAIVYFGINIGVSVWGIDWHHYTTFANRLGWYVYQSCDCAQARELTWTIGCLCAICASPYSSLSRTHHYRRSLDDHTKALTSCIDGAGSLRY